MIKAIPIKGRLTCGCRVSHQSIRRSCHASQCGTHISRFGITVIPTRVTNPGEVARAGSYNFIMALRATTGG